MTDLTEQWKKRELPSGWYWCKCYDEEIKLLYYDGDCFELDDPETKNYYFFSKEDSAEIAILGEVPTYEEYWHMISCLNDQTEILNENAKLKELLKDCKDIFDECFSPSVKYGKLYKKIDEVLK